MNPRDYPIWNQRPLLNGLPLDRLGDDEAGKQAFGVIHGLGKGILSAFGAGAVAQPLEDLYSQAGILPGTGAKKADFSVLSPNYVVIAHTSGMPTDVFSNAVQVDVVSGKRFNPPRGQEYKGGAVGKTYSFGIDQPKEIYLALKSGEKKNVVSDTRMVLFLGGNTGSGQTASTRSTAGTKVSGWEEIMRGEDEMLGAVPGAAGGVVGLIKDTQSRLGVALARGEISQYAYRAVVPLLDKLKAMAIGQTTKARVAIPVPPVAVRRGTPLVQVRANLDVLQKGIASAMASKTAPMQIGNSMLELLSKIRAQVPGAQVTSLPSSVAGMDMKLLGDHIVGEVVGEVVGDGSGWTEIAGDDYLAGTDLLGAVPVRRVVPRAGFVATRPVVPGGRPQIALRLNTPRRGNHTASIANARDAGNRAVALGQKVKAAIAKGGVKTKVKGDEVGLVTSPETRLPTSILGDVIGAVTAPVRAVGRALAPRRARPVMTPAQIKKLADNAIKAGKAALAGANKHQGVVQANTARVTSGLRTVRETQGRVGPQTRIHGDDVVLGEDTTVGFSLWQWLGFGPPAPAVPPAVSSSARMRALPLPSKGAGKPRKPVAVVGREIEIVGEANNWTDILGQDAEGGSVPPNGIDPGMNALELAPGEPTIITDEDTTQVYGDADAQMDHAIVGAFYAAMNEFEISPQDGGLYSPPETELIVPPAGGFEIIGEDGNEPPPDPRFGDPGALGDAAAAAATGQPPPGDYGLGTGGAGAAPLTGMAVSNLPPPPTVAPPLVAGQDFVPSPGPAASDNVTYTGQPLGAIVYDGSKGMPKRAFASKSWWETGASKGKGFVWGWDEMGFPDSPNPVRWIECEGMVGGFGLIQARMNWYNLTPEQIANVGKISGAKGYGPLIGDPGNLDFKDLRYDASSNAWFWFYDQAPQWAKGPGDLLRMNQAVLDYKAQVALATAEDAAAEAQAALDEKTAADLAKAQAAEDAAMARQHEQETKTAQHQAEVQSVAAQQQTAADTASATAAAQIEDESYARRLQAQGDYEARMAEQMAAMQAQLQAQQGGGGYGGGDEWGGGPGPGEGGDGGTTGATDADLERMAQSDQYATDASAFDQENPSE